MESPSINVGVIGVGGMGGRHAVNLARLVKNAHVTAVMDAVTARAQEVAHACGGAVVFDSAELLIEDSGVDTVVVASPDATHSSLVLKCIEAGKPVLCEKPLATSAEDAMEILAAEKRHGQPLVQVGFMRRYDPWHVAVKDAIVDGRIGEPKMFKGWHRNMQARKGVTSERIVLGSAIHDLDSARWMLGGEIVEVYVAGVNTDGELGTDVLDLQSIQICLDNGTIGQIEVAVSIQYGYEVGVEMVGSQGVVRTGLPVFATLSSSLTNSSAISSDWLERFKDAYRLEAQAWIDGVRTGQSVVGPGAWDGYASLAAAEACIRSLASGVQEKVSIAQPA